MTLSRMAQVRGVAYLGIGISPLYSRMALRQVVAVGDVLVADCLYELLERPMLLLRELLQLVFGVQDGEFSPNRFFVISFLRHDRSGKSPLHVF